MISQTRTRHPDDGEKMMRCPYSGTTNSTLLQRRHCSCCCTSCTLLHLLLLLLHLLLLHLLLLQRCSSDLEFCRQCSSGLLASSSVFHKVLSLSPPRRISLSTIIRFLPTIIMEISLPWKNFKRLPNASETKQQNLL